MLIPKKLNISIKVEKVLCGGNFTIIRLYSFGDNRYGQLGITGLNNIVLEHPAAINRRFKEVKDFSCGEEHAAYIDL